MKKLPLSIARCQRSIAPSAAEVIVGGQRNCLKGYEQFCSIVGVGCERKKMIHVLMISLKCESAGFSFVSSLEVRVVMDVVW